MWYYEGMYTVEINPTFIACSGEAWFYLTEFMNLQNNIVLREVHVVVRRRSEFKWGLRKMNA
jgi:hypothetical protein